MEWIYLSLEEAPRVYPWADQTTDEGQDADLLTGPDSDGRQPAECLLATESKMGGDQCWHWKRPKSD